MADRWSDLGEVTEPGVYVIAGTRKIIVDQSDIELVKIVGGDPILELLPRMREAHEGEDMPLYVIKGIKPKP